MDNDENRLHDDNDTFVMKRWQFGYYLFYICLFASFQPIWVHAIAKSNMFSSPSEYGVLSLGNFVRIIYKKISEHFLSFFWVV